MTAMASISTFAPRGRAATWTVLLAGKGAEKCFEYSSFIKEYSERSVMNTVVFTTSLRSAPTELRTDFRFSSDFAV